MQVYLSPKKIMYYILAVHFFENFTANEGLHFRNQHET
jgi:hypothetical protein